MPTRYALDVELKSIVTTDVVSGSNPTARQNARKEVKKILEDKCDRGPLEPSAAGCTAAACGGCTCGAAAADAMQRGKGRGLGCCSCCSCLCEGVWGGERLLRSAGVRGVSGMRRWPWHPPPGICVAGRRGGGGSSAEVGGGAERARPQRPGAHTKPEPLCLLRVWLIAAHPCLRRYNTSLKTNKNKWFFQKLRF